MKIRYFLCLAASSMLLASCAKDAVVGNEGDIRSADELKIESVRIEGFAPATRSSYTETYATKFETGDRLGLVLLREGEQTDHVSFSYTEGEGWKADKPVYYSESTDGIIAYYPYNEQLASDVADIAALKATVGIKADQSTVEGFKAADLLVAEVPPAKSLNIRLGHAFSLVNLSSKAVLEVGGESFGYSLSMSDISFVIGDTEYLPYQLNGTHVCVVKDGTQLAKNAFRYFYTVDGNPFIKTVETAMDLESGSMYTFPCIAGTGVAAGDFYCVTASGKMAVLPGAVSAIPEGLECKGIVVHAMDAEEFSGFASVNGLEAAGYPGYDGAHGLVISLKKGMSFGSVSNTADLVDACRSVGSFTDINASNGYILTRALSESSVSANISEVLENHSSDNLPNTTSWYIPSFNEVKYIIRGEDAETPSSYGKELINKRMEKAAKGSDKVDGNIPTATLDETSANNNVGAFRCFDGNGAGQMWQGIPGEAWYVICAF